MNILVLGASGQLGTCFMEYAKADKDNEYTAPSHSALDVTDPFEVEKAFAEIRPKIVLNFTAFNDVEGAELVHEEYSESMNRYVPKMLGELCKKYNALLVHISTDYVYAPYEKWEGEPFDVAPKGVRTRDFYNKYGKHKFYGEVEIAESRCRYIIIRTSWLYSKYGNNFVKKVLALCENGGEYTFPVDQIGTPTSAEHLANHIFFDIVLKANTKLIRRAGLLYNFSDYGACSRYDFAEMVKEMFDLFKHYESSAKILPCVSDDLIGYIAQRPYFSVMSSREFDVFFPKSTAKTSWSEGVEEVVMELV